MSIYGDNIFETRSLDSIITSLDESFKIFNSFNSINESAEETIKNIIEKIKQAFIALKNKIIEFLKKIKDFFKNIKYNKVIERITRFGKQKIDISNESANIVNENTMKKDLKDQEATLINIEAYKKIIDSVEYKKLDDGTIYIDSSKFNDAYDENYEKIFFKGTLYDFFQNKGYYVDIAKFGYDKAEEVSNHLEYDMHKCNEKISEYEKYKQKCHEAICNNLKGTTLINGRSSKFFSSARVSTVGDNRMYQKDIEAVNERISEQRELLEKLTKDFNASIKFLTLSKTVLNTVDHYAKKYGN